jgi:hypothetical protein
MALEHGSAPPLAPGKDILWLRRSISVTKPTSLFTDLRVANPALRSMVQLILVKTSSGDMLEAAGNGLGPVLLEPDDAGYMLLARSVIGTVPAGLDLGAEDFVCPWMLRMLHSTGSSIKVGKQPTEHVLDANGYYVTNYGRELFRYQINPPAPPGNDAEGDAAEGAEAGEPVPPTTVHMTMQLRTLSPAVVNMYLLDVQADQVWGHDLEHIDPITALCTASMERDGRITATPLHFAEGLNEVVLPEVRLVHRPGRLPLDVIKARVHLPPPPHNCARNRVGGALSVK